MGTKSDYRSLAGNRLVLCEVDESPYRSHLIGPYREARGVDYLIIDSRTTPESLVQQLRDQEYARFEHLQKNYTTQVVQTQRQAAAIREAGGEIDKLDAALRALKGVGDDQSK